MNIRWTHPDWAYLLGVVHGDGHISKRSISVSVGYRDQDYARVLVALWSAVGFNPKTYRQRAALRIDIHSAELRSLMAPFKVQGRWSWPSDLSWPHYLAGVIDTDGCVTLNRSIVITLKRGGNLSRLAEEINKLGIRPVQARDTQAVFCGRPYLTETLSITSMDRILSLCENISLRHPRKAQRLAEMLVQIRDIQSHVPLYQEVADWLKAEARTWKEIAAKFSLTHEQVDSLLCRLRRSEKLVVLPPPEALCRYRMSAQ